MNSFDKMYNAFNLFAKAIQVNNKKFLPLSAGVNWIESNSAILKLLHFELDSALTYRNYGRAVGSKIITDMLASIEKDIAQSKKKPSVIICNGSSEGSYLIFRYLSTIKHIKKNDSTLMLNYGFPLYNKLSEEFQLNFNEILLDKTSSQHSLLAPMDNIVETIKNVNPKIVFLIVPNNPLGEVYEKKDLQKLLQICSNLNIKIIIDRVCLLPWDDYETINEVFIEAILQGDVFIVDSFSKSESLAGIRTGYIVTNEKVEQSILKIIQYRSLNPIVYSTLTLAISKILSLKFHSLSNSNTLKYSIIIKKFIDRCLQEYPSEQTRDILNFLLRTNLITEYEEQTIVSKHRIYNNYNMLNEYFGEDALVNLNLKSGFNVTLVTDRMLAKNEDFDRGTLANKFNVGVLTESCFRKSANSEPNYFIRIGLTIPESEFSQAIQILHNYYKKN